MSEVHDDRPDSLVPADRPLRGADLRTVRFSTAVRGYRMAEVDALLERLAEEREAAEAERAGADTDRDAEVEPGEGLS
jgi:DivIVA domain-containing protein